jgi:hypothetical protein
VGAFIILKIKLKSIKEAENVKRITISLAPCLNLKIRCSIVMRKVRSRGISAGKSKMLV